MSIITTVKGARFDTDKPAKSNLCMVLDGSGNQVMDSLRITGKMETVTEFMQPVSMVEVETSYGTTQVKEDYLWQD